MEESDKKKQDKQKVTIFPVPFALKKIEENITITTHTPTKSSKEQIINQALKFHAQGNISEATKYYQELINQGCNDYRVFSNYGVILQNLGNLQEAEKNYRKSIELNPDFADAHSNLGGILRNSSKLQEAELSTRKAIELNPNLAEAHSNLGGILNDLGKLQVAELSYRKALELNPNLAEAHSNLGNILIDLGKLQEAELSLRKAIELNPNFTNAHFNLVNTLNQLGKLQEAELSLRKAIELNPNFANAYLNLGVILKDLGKLEEAEISTRKAIKMKPNLALAYQILGSILLHKGSQELSLKYFSESAQLLRGKKNKESNHQRFITISQTKIKHDIEQFEYIASQSDQYEKFTALANLYKKVATEITWPSETQLIDLSNEHQKLLKNIYNHLIHKIEAPKLKKEAVNNSLNIEKITQNYFDHDYGLTYIDNFLSPPALDSLRQFLLGSTIWFDIKPTGWIGAYLGEGLACPLILQIADELSKKFPRIFKDHPIKQIWAYKYDSRAKEKDSSLSGIHVHADPAAVNVNFWITPNEANLNPNSGGIVVYNLEAPKEWTHKSYNSNVNKIRAEIQKNNNNKTVIPYKENRAVVFNSDLFHETDNYEFKDGYKNRRINVTILFGNRVNN